MKKCVIVLALVGVSTASARSYSLTLAEPVVVGSTTLKAGDYKLDLEGSKVLFLDNRHKTAAQASVKVENEHNKYYDTAIVSNRVGDERRITAIELAGTQTKLVFN
jgi:hypothetical protein